jgi:hypothetical protein
LPCVLTVCDERTISAAISWIGRWVDSIDPAGCAGTKALARHMAAQREQLEVRNARYEKWSADTSGRREAAGKAWAELERRNARDVGNTFMRVTPVGSCATTLTDGDAASRSWIRVLAQLAPLNHQDHAMTVHPAGREAW